MDHDGEIGKFKWLLAAGAFFLASGYASYRELSYAVWGQTAEATIMDSFETSGGRCRPPQLVLKYTFAGENGAQRSGDDYLAIDWPVPADGKIQIQYLSDSDRSRVAGNESWVAVAFFLASLAWLAFALFQLYREAQDPTPFRKR